jgi:hypothetical protein
MVEKQDICAVKALGGQITGTIGDVLAAACSN